jgi:hypothetical protein
MYLSRALFSYRCDATASPCHYVVHLPSLAELPSNMARLRAGNFTGQLDVRLAAPPVPHIGHSHGLQRRRATTSRPLMRRSNDDRSSHRSDIALRTHAVRPTL